VLLRLGTTALLRLARGKVAGGRQIVIDGLWWLGKMAGMDQRWFPGIILSVLLGVSLTAAQEAEIVVHADQVSHRVSRYLTGACIEDVNHEIYGGLYSQMIFGESFQEPPPAVAPKGFAAYGGRWQVRDGVLWADYGQGPKLIADEPVVGTGEVGVEIFLPEPKGGNAGLILKASEAGVGADKFTGYEIALESGGRLVLGRHRQNWEPIRNVPCAVRANQWVSLVVRLAGDSIEVLVDGKSVLAYEDREYPLAAGRVGLRTWQREARFRNFYVQEGGQARKLRFDLAEAASPNREVSGMWRPFCRGSATGEWGLDTTDAFTGRQSQRLTFKAGEGEIGIENQSLNRWGMNFVKGKRYEGHVWLRAEQPARVFFALESADGAKVYAETSAEAKSAGRYLSQWQCLDFKLTPNAADKAGRFAIKLKGPGSVGVGCAFLQPGEWGRFKGLPVRRDVSEALVAQGLTVLRYGGSMVNDAEYRWKKMIGPRDRRPPYKGTWYPYSSNGWGILDFLNFCEAAGFLGIPALNMDETPADMADFMEYVNGPPKSDWGRRRAADGHPAPYRLKYIELGNEEAVDENYWRKFKALAEAIWAKDPGIILVVGDFAYDKVIEDPYNFSGAPNIRTLAAHKKILDLAREHGREVWFDVHLGTEQPPAPNGVPGVRSFIEQLGRISPGAKYKVAVFEFNAGNHALKRALANACAINQLERLGDRVAVACSANCLQPYKQNDNDWNQGLLFLSPSQVWPQPPYYVTQMVSRNYLPLCVKTEARSPSNALDVTAARSKDGKTLTLQVVNTAKVSMPGRIVLNGFAPRKPAALATVLTGDWEGINTPDQPGRTKPTESDWRHQFKDGAAASRTFPPCSFTILRFR
jgi:alpha-L-arabinofuranosidase